MGNVGHGISRIIQDVDGEAVVVNSGRRAVETEQDDAFTSMVTFGDLAIDTSALGNDLDTLCGTTGAPVTNAKEVLIQTDDANTGFVMVGGTQGTTLAGSVGSRAGIKLNGGETLVLAISSFASIFLIGSASNQYVNVAYFA